MCVTTGIIVLLCINCMLKAVLIIIILIMPRCTCAKGIQIELAFGPCNTIATLPEAKCLGTYGGRVPLGSQVSQ